jgi:hypothetical protein
LSGLLTAGCLTACQDDDASLATGEVSVRILADDALATSRAEVTPTQQMDLDVLDLNGGIVKSFKDAASNPVDRFTLPVGTYVFHAYSANQNNSAPYFDAGNAYYEVRDTLQVTQGSMQSVKLVCTLAMAKVSVNYNDTLKTNFTQLDCTVGHPSGSLLYNKEETRAGYFPATDSLTLTLQATNTKGHTYSTRQTIPALAPRTHYRVNYSIASQTAGTGEFQITFDATLNEMVFTVGVPLKPTYPVTLLTPDVYGQVAYLYAQSSLEDNTGLTFQYRLKETTDWVSVTPEQKVINGETVWVGKTNQLDFSNEYEYRMAVSDEAKSEVEAFTTESFVEIPNLGFETWTKVDYVYLDLGFLGQKKRDLWYPNADQDNSYWSTGNKGVVQHASCNSNYVEGDEARTGKSPRLTTTEISGIYAAGNLFIGEYNGEGSDGNKYVTFGREYAGARPLKLKGWYRYYATAITNTSGQYPDDANYTQDTGDIYIKLWDAQDNVIAEGHFIPEGTVEQYTKFEIPLTYTSKAKAAKITIVCTSSQYGGYFSGVFCVGKVGVGSILYVDDFELEYYK